LPIQSAYPNDSSPFGPTLLSLRNRHAHPEAIGTVEESCPVACHSSSKCCSWYKRPRRYTTPGVHVTKPAGPSKEQGARQNPLCVLHAHETITPAVASRTTPAATF